MGEKIIVDADDLRRVYKTLEEIEPTLTHREGIAKAALTSTCVDIIGIIRSAEVIEASEKE